MCGIGLGHSQCWEANHRVVFFDINIFRKLWLIPKYLFKAATTRPCSFLLYAPGSHTSVVYRDNVGNITGDQSQSQPKFFYVYDYNPQSTLGTPAYAAMLNNSVTASIPREQRSSFSSYQLISSPHLLLTFSV